MPQSLRECFILQDFNPDRYVKDLSSQCIGADELRQQRAKIQDLADNTSALLKLNVYQNYIQFIETAKEISHLESEMYQLSQLLSEQRSLLNTLGTNQISLENNSEIEEHSYIDLKLKEETKQLIQLLENVEGAISLIETPGRICLHDGSLLELDSLDSTPLRRVHAYLFNDVLMIASWMNNTNRRGLPKYKMQVVYDLQNLAVVNIKDLGPVKFAFKLLAFPDTRIFQCATAISKKEWLEKCDHAKRLRICKENQPESSVKKCTNYLEPIVAVSQSSSIQLDIDAENLNKVEFFKPLPEWIVEFTEELDSYVAQRHYEDAYYLLKKTKRFLKNVHNISQYHGVKEKLIDKANFLVNILTKELESSVEIKSLQGGGLRSAKKVVKLLIQLNRSTQAHQLYLMLCTATLKGQLKKVKREGAIVSYVKELSAIAFSNIAEMAQDFLKIFPRHSYCTSVFRNLHEKGLSISSEAAEKIKKKLDMKTLIRIRIEYILNELKSGKLVPKAMTSRNYQLHHFMKTLDVEKLEKTALEHNSNSVALSCMQTKALIHYCYSMNEAKVEELLKEFKNSDRHITESIHALLICMYVNLGKVDKAEFWLNEGRNKFPNFGINKIMNLKLMTALVENSEIKKAEQYIEWSIYSNVQKIALNKLLTAIAKYNDEELLHRFFDQLSEHGYVGKLSPNLLQPFVQLHISRNDGKAAQQKFQWLYNTYGQTPYPIDLMKKLITDKDQKILDQITTFYENIFGKSKCYFYLAIAHLENNDLKTARDLIQQNCVNISEKNVLHFAESYYSNGQIDKLEKLFAVLNESKFDVECLCVLLLKSYSLKKEWRKCYELWLKMQEDRIRASPTFYAFFDEILESKEIENNESLKKFHDAIQNSDLVAARNMLDSIPKIYKSDCYSILCQKYISSGYTYIEILDLWRDLNERFNLNLNLYTAEFILGKLQNLRELRNIEIIGTYLTPELKKQLNYSYYLNKTYAISGSWNLYLKKLEKNLHEGNICTDDDLDMHYKTALYTLLKYPELLNQSLIVWCSNEIDFLTSHLSKQMFIPQVSLNALAECITTIRDHCEQLSQIGLDFRSQFDRQIRTPLIKILQDAKEKYIDVVKIRGAEDNFKPCNFQSVQSHKKFISELEDLGIYIPDSYDKNKHYSSLTNNTLNFSKLYIGLLEDCLNLYTSEVIIAIDEILYSILQLYMQHLQTSFIRSRLKQEKVLLQDNFNYIQNVIISRSLELYQSVTGQQFEQMLEMKKQPLSLTCPSAKPQPAPRNLIKKFSTDEYV